MIPRSIILLFLLCQGSPAVAQTTHPVDSLVAVNRTQLNTAANEYGPLLSHDGATFYFMQQTHVSRGCGSAPPMQREGGWLPDGSRGGGAIQEVEQLRLLYDGRCWRTVPLLQPSAHDGR